DGSSIEVPPGSDVDVNFYPYGVEARAVDPFYSSAWNDYWWYDPIYWTWPYYPYYGPGWSFSIGWGWGWGWGGGYYCSGWYAPYNCGYYDGYYYPPGSYTYPEKFKAKYKSASASTLTETRAVAAKRDGSLRIASKNVQESLSRPAQSSMRSKTGSLARTTYGSGKSRGAIDAAPRVKTSIGGRSSGIKSTPRGATRGSATPPRVRSTGSTPRKSVAGVPRGGGGYKSRGVAPGTRGSSRSSGARMGSSPQSPRAKSTPSRSYSAPSSRGGSSFKGSAPRSAPSSGARGASRGGKGR
ncbi:MAG: hypothetical protein L0Z51_09800, partial [Candidatus Latescibacteria bacterium]|nr:hypothetical protein [Candidatus Latescibacterota bacterium]